MNYFHFLATSLTILVLNVNAFAQKTYYVTSTGTGQGTSWSDANQDVNAILFAAKPGDEVWIAKGTYLPTMENNRTAAFFIPSDVKVYGGFSGNETVLSQRNAFENKTILSGEINTTDAHDNSFNVVIFKSCSNQTVLDGFTISGGTGNGTGTTGERNRCGGGIYIDGSDKASMPIVSNCIVKNNVSRDGGAVYNNGVAGKANPTFINCLFASNQADFDGGAIFNDGRDGGQSNPSFIQCEIISNQANYGGGVYNYAGNGESSPSFDCCKFKSNEVQKEGVDMFSMELSGKCQPIIKNTTIAKNQLNDKRDAYTSGLNNEVPTEK